ncbi:uncharacterized protein ACLA_014290 [Aspergillus clavatus NRRL 1]|uniref:Uncharacterized protein n=1 Tax=Aspergillus clavatus (strain ATCC 1007 / CBS 513.65 / DSM 816 / NCTC 3887 / NRRL 1 / QM 1276 / 107) TaxID=344612 RepID=A1CB74_ASPCL|nr:uncharacterized protein ACLA_014290 [Aspergillus clavatus NRRL 1]EAW12992.1 hypothetical protein ACLA_014290 [Aspergillus clavatus NRRL 1]
MSPALRELFLIHTDKMCQKFILGFIDVNRHNIVVHNISIMIDDGDDKKIKVSAETDSL